MEVAFGGGPETTHHSIGGVPDYPFVMAPAASNQGEASAYASAVFLPIPTTSRPVSALLARLAAFKALAVNKDVANACLGPLVCQALASPLNAEGKLSELVHKYGWDSCQGFMQLLDLPGFRSALQKFIYHKTEFIGQGSFGTVWKSLNMETRELVAIKKLRAAGPGSWSAGLSDSTIREICTMRELQHENIVRLKDIISTVNGTHVHLVLECLDCDLRAYLDQHAEASALPRIKSVIYQLLRGIRYAHTNSIMHRDLKPQNILVDVKTGQIKLTDFGLARAFLPCDRAYSEKVVTLYYRAPELLLGAQRYSPAIDMWSVGCILAELINFTPLFKSDNEIGLLHQIFEKLGTPTPEMWHDLPTLPLFQGSFQQCPPQPMSKLVPRLAHDDAGMDLLSRLLTFDPAQRLTAGQALQHVWFRDISHQHS